MSEQTGIGTNIVCQIGLVVKDIEKSAAAYCDILGLPHPAITVTDEYDKAQTVYRGQPSEARAKLAFFDMGQVQLELIEPDGKPSTWQEALDEKGEGVHHIAFFVKDSDKVVAYLEGKGAKLVQQGRYTGGMYSYVDAIPQLHLVLELLENFA
ncbi:MAG TPA: VOC family protein [Anaerolineae bacterium]|nr:VOC family protein [Anaerolineae bacterium]HQH38889.1 VOC family protein [Anaerolineae bacterium]